MIIAGGGAVNAAGAVRELAERIGAAVAPTIAAKGILPGTHPLGLEVTIDRPATQALVSSADVVLCVGSELAEPDIWRDAPLEIDGKLIRIDIDPVVLARDYDVEIAIHADADVALRAILATLPEASGGFTGSDAIAKVRDEERLALSPLECMHVKVLDALKEALPADGMVFTDMTQLAYTGYAFYRSDRPRQWFFPAGYGTLGYALPAAIGGQLAAPRRPVAVIVGDGGFQFTLQELGTAVEQKLPIAIILWNNNSLAQIRDGMIARNIPTIGVNQHNPDFLKLADAYGCRTAKPDSLTAFTAAVAKAFTADGPTVIELCEDAPFLASA